MNGSGGSRKTRLDTGITQTKQGEKQQQISCRVSSTKVARAGPGAGPAGSGFAGTGPVGSGPRADPGPAIGTSCDCIPPLERGDQELSNDITVYQNRTIIKEVISKNYLFLLARPWDQPQLEPAPVGASPSRDQVQWDQPQLAPAPVGTSPCQGPTLSWAPD